VALILSAFLALEARTLGAPALIAPFFPGELWELSITCMGFLWGQRKSAAHPSQSSCCEQAFWRRTRELPASSRRCHGATQDFPNYFFRLDEVLLLSLWRLFLRNRGFPTASAKKVTWSCLDILKVSRMYQSRLMVKIVSPFTIPRLAVFKGKSQARA